MINKTFLQTAFRLFLLISIFTVSLPQTAFGQTAVQTKVSYALRPKLRAIEDKLERRRQELGIPGLALAIVKDDQIIFLKGFGYRDFEKQIAVTPDSQFAVGSATKAFTALSVLMLEDEGKLSLGDNPKKYLPYFKINDPEIDKNITIRDLLSHSSGLNRTDLGWVTGKLTREEIIRVAGEAKPTSKLREKFQYQNVMYAAAGEIVARVEKTPWEQFIAEKIFKPLGMNNSNASIEEMRRAKDFSFGYDFNFDTEQTRRLPMRDLNEIAPAGSINSSARDIAEWLRFILNRGFTGDGKRLISEAGFEEWLKPQMKISGNASYSLGWFLQNWNGLEVVQHGGNIDGFNSLVAMIPEKNLGFVLLTNVSGSSLGSELMPIIWENVLGNQNFSASQTKVRREESEIESSGPAKELVGKYAAEKNSAQTLEVVEKDGRISLVAEGQQPYELRQREKDTFGMFPLPNDYNVKVERDSSGKLLGISIIQPEGEFGFRRIENSVASSAPTMTLEELMSKVVRALGGEANWRKLKSRLAVIEVDFIHQGVRGTQTQYAKAPNLSSSETVITALGKPIAKISEYFNGTKGGEETTFSPAEQYAGKQLEDARINSDFYGLINWRTNYRKAEIKGAARIGDEETIVVVVFEPEKANKDTIYFSTKTFLPVKLESVSSLSTQNISLPYAETYSDYRLVDGVMIPFKTVNSSVGNGDIVTTIKEIKHNVEIPNKVFRLNK